MNSIWRHIRFLLLYCTINFEFLPLRSWCFGKTIKKHFLSFLIIWWYIFINIRMIYSMDNQHANPSVHADPLNMWLNSLYRIATHSVVCARWLPHALQGSISTASALGHFFHPSIRPASSVIPRCSSIKTRCARCFSSYYYYCCPPPPHYSLRILCNVCVGGIVVFLFLVSDLMEHMDKCVLSGFSQIFSSFSSSFFSLCLFFFIERNNHTHISFAFF